MNVHSKVLESLHRRGFKGYEMDDYIKAGAVDSLGLLGFVLELEDMFKVELSDEEVASDEFRTVEGLVSLIERKMT